MTVNIESASQFTDRQGRVFQSLSIRIVDERLQANPNDLFKVIREGVQVGMIRFLGLNHVRYLEKTSTPPMEIAVATDVDVRGFIGAQLVKL